MHKRGRRGEIAVPSATKEHPGAGGGALSGEARDRERREGSGEGEMGREEEQDDDDELHVWTGERENGLVFMHG